MIDEDNSLQFILSNISAFNITGLRIEMINSMYLFVNRNVMTSSGRNILALSDIYHIMGMHDVVNVKMLTVEGRAGK